MPLMRWFTKSKFKEALEFPARLGLEFGGLLAAVVVIVFLLIGRLKRSLRKPPSETYRCGFSMTDLFRWSCWRELDRLDPPEFLLPRALRPGEEGQRTQ